MGNGRRRKNKSRVKKNKEEVLTRESGADEHDGIAYIENLPPEMLLQILKYVDTPSLFKCRLVNREWCRISSEISCTRPETEIEFRFQDSVGFRTYHKNSGKTLKDFMDCFNDSINCPCARLSIFDDSYDEEPTFFHHEDWLPFLSDYDISSVKGLKLVFSKPSYDEKWLINLTKNIRDLLTNKIPHLEEFELWVGCDEALPEIQLFPEIAKTPGVPAQFQLPNLKVIRFQDNMFCIHPKISKGLLDAAVNVKRVHVYPVSRFLLTEAFTFLHSVRKLHLVKEIEIELNPNFLSEFQQCSNPTLSFKLKELKLSTVKIFNNPSATALEHVVTFLSNLFETSKDSLRKLSMQPLGFSRNLNLSRLKNLTELKLDQNGYSVPFFLAGVRNLDIFPAVRHLVLEGIQDWSAGFPLEDFIPHFPSLTTLSVSSGGITRDAIAVMALLCPNLKDLKVCRDQNVHAEQLNFLQLGRFIWTHMKQLEYLEVDIDLSSAGNNSLTLNSCFTGISMHNCQRLHEMMEAKQTLEKHGVSVDISKSKWRVQREHPSILDMKALRKLTVNTYDSTGDKCRFSKWSWVTREHVFKLAVYYPTLALGHFSNPFLATGSPSAAEAGAQQETLSFAKLCTCKVCKQAKKDYFLISHEF